MKACNFGVPRTCVLALYHGHDRCILVQHHALAAAHDSANLQAEQVAGVVLCMISSFGSFRAGLLRLCYS